MFNCTKRFDNFPFAHRQPNHEGHCYRIHGHNWSFEFEFRCNTTDENNFVIDFGSLSWLREQLKAWFDHTLVLNRDDPFYTYFVSCLVDLTARPFAKIVAVPNCGAEGLALFLHDEIAPRVVTRTSGRVHLSRVTVFEDDRNSATYQTL